MDDGYADSHRQYDRAELAEQRLKIATDALKYLIRGSGPPESTARLALKRIADHQLKV